MDTLIVLCTAAVDRLDSEDDIVRCLDAISRLCDQRSSGFVRQTAPLAARVQDRLGAQAGMQAYAAHPLGVVIWSWLSRQDTYGLCTPGGRIDFMAAWVRGLARRVARGQAAPLLAAPTHSRGWIDPHVLVNRFRLRSKLSIAEEPEDLILALLRLAPDHRGGALSDAGDLKGEEGSAIRYALGSHEEVIGTSAPLWVAAARARLPWADDPAVEARHPGLGPDAGQAATYKVDGRSPLKRRGMQAILEIRREPEIPEDGEAASRLPTVTLSRSAALWPLALESFCAQGAMEMLRFHESSTTWPWGLPFLLPLVDPDVPLRSMARLVMALGMNGGHPELAGLATDVLAAGIDDGRLDTETLGESLRLAWQLRVESGSDLPSARPSPDLPESAPIVKPVRWAKALGNAARISPLHARVIALAIEYVLMDEATKYSTTRSLVPLLELLKEAFSATGMAVSAEFRAYLGTVNAAGAAGRLVKDLLDLREVPDSPALRIAQTRPLAHRIARAQRWEARERASS